MELLIYVSKLLSVSNFTKRRFFIVLQTILIVLFLCTVSFADRSSDIRYLLSISGLGEMVEGMFNYQADLTVNEFKKERKISKEFEKEFRSTIVEVMLADFWSPGGLADMLIPTYDGFNHAEIIELIRFHQSPIGKKMSKNASRVEEVLRNMVPVWNKRVSEVILPKIVAKMHSKGYDKDGNKIN
jgi:hypothetical protein